MTLWLASFPRSGNTLLRQVLHAGWGLLSGSVYSEDLGDNLALIRACGHVDLRIVPGEQRPRFLNPLNLPVKTHQLPQDTDKAIYILRDGRAACVSLWQFWKREVALEDIVCGRNQFGLWSDHVMAWTGQGRLAALLRYERMVEHPEETVRMLSTIFGPPSADPTLPLRNRAHLAQHDGTWVRPAADWRDHWSDRLEEAFQQHHAPAIAKFALQHEWQAGPDLLSPSPAAYPGTIPNGNEAQNARASASASR